VYGGTAYTVKVSDSYLADYGSPISSEPNTGYRSQLYIFEATGIHGGADTVTLTCVSCSTDLNVIITEYTPLPAARLIQYPAAQYAANPVSQLLTGYSGTLVYNAIYQGHTNATFTCTPFTLEKNQQNPGGDTSAVADYEPSSLGWVQNTWTNPGPQSGSIITILFGPVMTVGNIVQAEGNSAVADTVSQAFDLPNTAGNQIFVVVLGYATSGSVALSVTDSRNTYASVVGQQANGIILAIYEASSIGAGANTVSVTDTDASVGDINIILIETKQIGTMGPTNYNSLAGVTSIGTGNVAANTGDFIISAAGDRTLNQIWTGSLGSFVYGQAFWPPPGGMALEVYDYTAASTTNYSSTYTAGASSTVNVDIADFAILVATRVQHSAKMD
jgi:hypothetical protein